MAEKNRVKYSIRNGVAGLFSQFFIILLGFVARGFFVSYLGQELLGINGAFTNILSILSVTELGIGSSITYCLYKPVYDDDREKIAGIMNLFKKFYVIIGLVIMLGALLVTPFLQHFVKNYTYDLNYIRLIFVLYAFNSTITYFMGYCRILFIATQRNYVVTLVDFVAKVLLQVGQILVLVFTQNFVIYLLLGTLSNILSNYIIRRFYYQDYADIVSSKAKIDEESKRSIISAVKYLSISSLISVGVFGTDNLIISSIIGVTASGIYSNYTMIITNLQTLFTSLLNGVTASLGNLMAEGDRAKIRRMFSIYDFAYFLVASFTTVSLYAMLNPFIANIWIRKDGYLLSMVIVGVLVTNNYMTYKRQPVWQFQNTAGIFKYFIPYSFIELILNLVVSIVLAQKLGLIGVFIGTTVAYTVSWIGQICVLHKHVLYTPPLVYILKQLFYMALTVGELALVIYLSETFAFANVFVQFIFITSLCALIPNGINVLLFYHTDEFKYLLDTVVMRLLNKVFKRRREE